MQANKDAIYGILNGLKDGKIAEVFSSYAFPDLSGGSQANTYVNLGPSASMSDLKGWQSCIKQ